MGGPNNFKRFLAVVVPIVLFVGIGAAIALHRTISGLAFFAESDSHQ